MNQSKSKLHSIATALALTGLVLSACTRSASSNPVPTATTAPEVNVPSGGGGGGGTQPVETDPTMAALGTQVAGSMTATAVALSVGGGGGEAPGGTPVAPEATPIPAATPTPLPTATPTGCPNPYTVKEGEWIYKIARDCHVEPSAIIAANPGIIPDFIAPGQKLNMPSAGAPLAPGATPQACSGAHTVAQGENLFRIAYNCGLTTEEMALFNGIPYPYTIHPGDVLKYP